MLSLYSTSHFSLPAMLLNPPPPKLDFWWGGRLGLVAIFQGMLGEVAYLYAGEVNYFLFFRCKTLNTVKPGNPVRSKQFCQKILKLWRAIKFI